MNYLKEIKQILYILLSSCIKYREDTEKNTMGITITGFTLSWWLTADSNSILTLLQCTVVGKAADVTEIYKASIFVVKLYKVAEFL
jgi:hypothetical protein